MKFEIKHRFNGTILFALQCDSMKLCVEAAVKSGAYLRGADLGGANLRGADLGGANLRGADLGGADLGGANLRGHKIRAKIGIITAGDPNNWNAMGLVDDETGELWVSVGCRLKEIAEGRAYWSSPDHPHLFERREVLAALDYIEAIAKLRGWSEPTPEDRDG